MSVILLKDGRIKVTNQWDIINFLMVGIKLQDDRKYEVIKLHIDFEKKVELGYDICYMTERSIDFINDKPLYIPKKIAKNITTILSVGSWGNDSGKEKVIWRTRCELLNRNLDSLLESCSEFSLGMAMYNGKRFLLPDIELEE
jgi:hypothetical protein